MTKRSSTAGLLIGLLLGIGSPGAVFVCFGADGHIEVVSASEDHCCEGPSHTPLRDDGQRCSFCFDLPLPLGVGEAFLLPAGGEVQDLQTRAESGVCGRALSPMSPGPPEGSPATASWAGGSAIQSLSSVVLLI